MTDYKNSLYVLYGSRTGNSKTAAVLVHAYARFLGIESELINMQEFVPERMSDLKNVLIAVSTHGEGDPPVPAEDLLHYLSGQKASRMKETRFSVLALGDSSYRHFCKTGHDFEENLLRLGAQKIHELQECDIDFEENAKRWIEGAVNAFREILPGTEKHTDKSFTFELNRPDAGMVNAYLSKIIEKRILNEGNPANTTLHITLSLKNSGMLYQPGDLFGVYSYNSRLLVDKLIKQMGFDPTYVIGQNKEKKMLKQTLVDNYELTLLTPVVIRKYAELTNIPEVFNLLANQKVLNRYCEIKDVLDLVQDFPAILSVGDFLSVLRKLPSRLYSVASSPQISADKVDLMVRLVEFKQGSRIHRGLCSSFLSTRIEEGESVGIFLEKNEKFRLPADDVPIVMIGTGTGLAPFRAFLQERHFRGAPGKNWLFFGERHRDTDFFYREELENYQKSGLLTRLDTAFSRDQTEKVYVTDRMLEHSHEFFRWLRAGAVVYICGNKRKLAISARKTILQIIQQEGHFSTRGATIFFDEIKAEKRYREDVY